MTRRPEAAEPARCDRCRGSGWVSIVDDAGHVRCPTCPKCGGRKYVPRDPIEPAQPVGAPKELFS